MRLMMNGKQMFMTESAIRLQAAPQTAFSFPNSISLVLLQNTLSHRHLLLAENGTLLIISEDRQVTISSYHSSRAAKENLM